MGIKSTVAEPWTSDLIYVIFCLILHKMHIVGTLKNRLRETILLSTINWNPTQGKEKLLKMCTKKCAYREYCYRVTIDGFSWSQA